MHLYTASATFGTAPICLTNIQLHPGVKMKLPRYDKVRRTCEHLSLGGLLIFGDTNSETLFPVCLQW